MNTFSTTLPTTDPRARAGLNSLRTGYSPMAMPIPVAAQTNSMSAVVTTALSLPANLAKSTGAPTVAPSGTMLSMDAAEQRMNRTPTAISFPLYDFIVSRLHCLNTGTRRQGDAQHDQSTLDRPSWAVIGTKVPVGPTVARSVARLAWLMARRQRRRAINQARRATDLATVGPTGTFVPITAHEGRSSVSLSCWASP